LQSAVSGDGPSCSSGRPKMCWDGASSIRQGTVAMLGGEGGGGRKGGEAAADHPDVRGAAGAGLLCGVGGPPPRRPLLPRGPRVLLRYAPPSIVTIGRPPSPPARGLPRVGWLVSVIGSPPSRWWQGWTRTGRCWRGTASPGAPQGGPRGWGQCDGGRLRAAARRGQGWGPWSSVRAPPAPLRGRHHGPPLGGQGPLPIELYQWSWGSWWGSVAPSFLSGGCPVIRVVAGDRGEQGSFHFV